MIPEEKRRLVDSFLKQLYKDLMKQRIQNRINDGFDDVLGFVAREMGDSRYVHCIRVIKIADPRIALAIVTETPQMGVIALNLDYCKRVENFMAEHHLTYDDMNTYDDIRQWYDEVLIPELGLREIQEAQAI